MAYLDIKEIIPKEIVSGKNNNKYSVNINAVDNSYFICYYSIVANQTSNCVGKKKHFFILPRKISVEEEFFEVMGLLQGEMSKTRFGILTFANSEVNIINKVLNWFSEELKISKESWHWYIKVNISHSNKIFYKNLEDELINYWVGGCNIYFNSGYKKKLIYTKSSKNKHLVNKGTLMIERRNPIFVQIVQELVKKVTSSIMFQKKKHISAYLRGLIAAEGCVNFNKKRGIYRVFISAKKQEERDIYTSCLKNLGIESYDCKPIGTIVISRKINIIKLKNSRLLDLHSEKKAKFEEMVLNYKE